MLAKRGSQEQWPLFLLAGFLAICPGSSLMPCATTLIRCGEFLVNNNVCKQRWESRQANDVGEGGL